MILYATFKGFKNLRYKTSKYVWVNTKNELGQEIEGEFYTNNLIENFKLKFGNRYMFECDDESNVTHIKQVNKTPRCDVFRRFKDEFHMIGGKYAGKKDKDLTDDELNSYVIWLAKNTENEATKLNCLAILKKIKNER